MGVWRNNKYTKFYLNQTRNDISIGNTTPITFIESNISWDSQNNMVCNDNGSSYIVLQNFDSNVFAAGSQWTIDMWFKLSSNANNYEYNNLVCQTNNSSGNNYLDESIGLGIRYMKLTRYYFAENCIDSTSAPTLDVSLEKNRWYHTAVEKMLINNIWHLFYYLDGNIVCDLPLKKEILPFKSHSVSLPSGSSDDNGRRFRGLICRPRISSTAIFGGKNFVVGDRII